QACDRFGERLFGGVGGVFGENGRDRARALGDPVDQLHWPVAGEVHALQHDADRRFAQETGQDGPIGAGPPSLDRSDPLHNLTHADKHRCGTLTKQPSSMRTTRVANVSERSSWAISRVVRPSAARLRPVSRLRAVFGSRPLSGSSRIRTGALRRMARAMAMR